MLSQMLKRSRLFAETTWREARLSEGTASHSKMMMDGYLASRYTCCSEAVQSSTCTHFRLGNSVSCICPYTPSSSSPHEF